MAGNKVVVEFHENELDLYDDFLISENDNRNAVKEIKLQRCEHLEKENEQLRRRNAELENEIETIKNRNDALKRNISVLYKTAKQDIERKDGLLRDLQERYDKLVFKRQTRAKASERNDISKCILASESFSSQTDSKTEVIANTNKRNNQCFTDRNTFKRKCVDQGIDDRVEHRSLLNSSPSSLNKVDVRKHATEDLHVTLGQNLMNGCHISGASVDAIHVSNGNEEVISHDTSKAENDNFKNFNVSDCINSISLESLLEITKLCSAKNAGKKKTDDALSLPNLTDSERIIAFRKGNCNSVLRKPPEKEDVEKSKINRNFCGGSGYSSKPRYVQKTETISDKLETTETHTKYSGQKLTTYKSALDTPNGLISSKVDKNIAMKHIIHDNNKDYRKKDLHLKCSESRDRGKYRVESSAAKLTISPKNTHQYDEEHKVKTRNVLFGAKHDRNTNNFVADAKVDSKEDRCIESRRHDKLAKSHHRETEGVSEERPSTKEELTRAVVTLGLNKDQESHQPMTVLSDNVEYHCVKNVRSRHSSRSNSHISSSLPDNNSKLDSNHKDDVEDGEICSDDDHRHSRKTRVSSYHSSSKLRECDLNVKDYKHRIPSSRSRSSQSNCSRYSKERGSRSAHHKARSPLSSHRSCH